MINFLTFPEQLANSLTFPQILIYPSFFRVAWSARTISRSNTVGT